MRSASTQLNELLQVEALCPRSIQKAKQLGLPEVCRLPSYPTGQCTRLYTTVGYKGPSHRRLHQVHCVLVFFFYEPAEVNSPYHIVEAMASAASVKQAKEAAAHDVMQQLRQRVNEHRCRFGLDPVPEVGIRYHAETQPQAESSNVSLLVEYAAFAFKPNFVADAVANSGRRFAKGQGSKDAAKNAAASRALLALSRGAFRGSLGEGGSQERNPPQLTAPSQLQNLCATLFRPTFVESPCPSWPAAGGFTMHCEMGGFLYPSARAGGKTAAKEAAARAALEVLEASPASRIILDRIRGRAALNSQVFVPRLLQGPASSEGEQMVQLVQEQLQLMYEEASSAGISLPSASRSVVVAAIVQKRGRAPGSRHADKLSVVAIATGNKSLHPSQKSNACAGQHILDFHA
eukprot:gene4969-34747_t